MTFFIQGTEAESAFIEGEELGGFFINGELAFEATSIIAFDFSRTLDRTFTAGGVDYPASGGGNVSPQEFTHVGNDGDEDATWQVWQVIPFIGGAIGDTGDCRVQLRDRSVSRGQNQLENMPRQVIISGADWTGLPWTFTRPTANRKYSSPGSGNNARRAIDYEPVRSPLATPAASGIAQGETFNVRLIF